MPHYEMLKNFPKISENSLYDINSHKINEEFIKVIKYLLFIMRDAA